MVRLLLSSTKTRFLSSPCVVRVPFFLLFGLIRGPQQKKGKRILLRNLEEGARGFWGPNIL